MKTKVAVFLSGALVALLLLARYFALSQAGMPMRWMLYLGLPITAAGVLFALRLINLSAGWAAQDRRRRRRGKRDLEPPTLPMSLSPLEAWAAARLNELQAMHAKGAISDSEYTARRLLIISNT
jgi:hypothetical protein